MPRSRSDRTLMPPDHRKPMLVLATVDPVLRDSALFDLVSDRPGLVAVRHDILDDHDGGGLRRVVVCSDGVLEDRVLPLEHTCLSCAVREDALPTLGRLARDRRWDSLLLALPVSAESLPVARALGWATRRGGSLRSVRVAQVLTALDLSTLGHDLLGDDLLDERGLALTLDDRRSVGEAVAAQLGHADTVVLAGEPGAHPVASDLVEHVRAHDSARLDGLHAMETGRLLGLHHDAARADARLDPLLVAPSLGAPTGHGVWTIELCSRRPLHPERLVEHVERLGNQPVRSRGHFWVPSRPDSVCVWDGSGGQLSVGEMGTWGRREPGTRLVLTGVEDCRDELVEAFREILMTEEEMAAGLAPWLGRQDVLEPWLGERSPA